MGTKLLDSLGNLFAVVKIMAIVCVTLLLLPFLLLMCSTKIGKRSLIQFFFILVTKIIGMRIMRQGHLTPQRPLLLVSNHASYLDIPALNRCFDCVFVSKKGVRDWPVIGWLTELSGAIFFDRKRSEVLAERKMLKDLLCEEATPVVLFAEGTTSDGNKVLPFKSTMFSLVEHQMQEAVADEKERITIQPISLAYTHKGKKKLTAASRKLYTWALEDDIPFFPHIWRVLKTGSFTLQIKLHPPVDIQKHKSRKELTSYCENIVRKGWEEMV